MNAWGVLVFWTAVQVTAFCALGGTCYLIVRRWGPAAGAWTAGMALLIVPVISALALVPWSGWKIPERAPSTQVQLAAPAPVAAKVSQETAQLKAESPKVEPADELAESNWSKLLGPLQFVQPAVDDSAVADSWNWPAWLLAGVVAVCGLGLMQFACSMISVARFRRRTRHVCDPELNHLLIAVCQQLHCTAPVELRETDEFCSPSTSGWLWPMIVLPKSWRKWNETERRAVIAHEVAHVVRGDFALWTATRLAALAHVYNPLVRWLLARLQLEQELAADSLAAEAAGGASTYLAVLARMALERDRVTFASASQPFLPRPRTLMRRIEMLSRNQPLGRVTLPVGRRVLLAGVLLVGGLFVAGVRGPLERAQALAADPPAAGKGAAAASAKDGPAFNLDFVPDNAQLVMACRPAEVAKMKSLGAVRVMFDGLGMFESLTLPLEEIEEVKFSLAGTLPSTPTNDGSSVFMLRSKKPHDWSKFATNFLGATEQAVADGQQYFRSTNKAPGNSSYWLPDDRTIVIAPTSSIAKTFSMRGAGGGPAWKEKWAAVAHSPAVVLLQRPLYESFVSMAQNSPNAALPIAATGDDVLLLSASESKSGVLISGSLACASAQDAEAEVTRLQQAFKSVVARSTQLAASAPQSGPMMIQSLMVQLLQNTKVRAEGAMVRSETLVNLQLQQPVAQAMGEARAAAQRAHSTNKMKQLAIALHNYHDTYKRFPAPAVMGPDGKTPHSWRLELLPFMEVGGKDIYDQYKQDEPWDSEHNAKLIPLAAKYFSLPSDKENKYCGYLAITGPGTIFDETAQPMSMRKISDGTSRTIWFVEAKSEIPWSKPEDLVIDADKPLPKLGGINPNSITVSYADGSVRSVPDTVNEKTWRALFSRAGREVINTGPNGEPVNLEE